MRKQYTFKLAVLSAVLLANPVTSFADARDDAIALAKSVAQEQMGISGTRIRFVQTQAREWRDSSLGCPEKGMVYQPVITAGYEVTLITDASTYTFHVAGERVETCSPATGTPRQKRALRDNSVIHLVELARSDFAERLGDCEQPIRVTSMVPREWPDASLGCPAKDMSYAQVVTPGFIIELESDGRTAAYHTDRQRVVYCEK